MSSSTIIVSTWFRVILGGWMLFWGLNHFTLFQPQPLGIGSREVHLAFMHSGLFAVAKVIEIIFGILLLANRFMPGALIMAYPVTVIVAYMDIVLEDIFWVNVSGIVIITVHSVLLLYYLRYYTNLFRWRAEPAAPKLADVLPGIETQAPLSGSAMLSGETR